MSALVHEPDAMGVWSDDGEAIWLPRSLYPNRLDAIKWAMREWGLTLPEIRCLSRWMRYQPQVVPAYTTEDGEEVAGWSEDLWWECAAEDEGAFRVWRLESA